MANYNDNAFNNMSNIDPDLHISGGAIVVSEYENNMSPSDQKKYEDTLLQSFRTAFERDPYKRSLNFDQWLNSLKPELYRERAKKWEDLRASTTGLNSIRNMDPHEAGLLEDAGLMERLSHLHTGRIEDLIEIVDSVAAEDDPFGDPGFGFARLINSPPSIQPAELRRPQNNMTPDGQY